jgi:hypothetical protein
VARGSIRSPRASQPEPPRHLVRSELQRPVGAARETGKLKRSRFKAYPIGFFHIDLAEVPNWEPPLFSRN